MKMLALSFIGWMVVAWYINLIFHHFDFPIKVFLSITIPKCKRPNIIIVIICMVDIYLFIHKLWLMNNLWWLFPSYERYDRLPTMTVYPPLFHYIHFLLRRRSKRIVWTWCCDNTVTRIILTSRRWKSKMKNLDSQLRKLRNYEMCFHIICMINNGFSSWIRFVLNFIAVIRLSLLFINVRMACNFICERGKIYLRIFFKIHQMV